MKAALGSLEKFALTRNRTGALRSLPSLEQQGFGAVSRLPVCLRVLLESVARNVDGERVTEQDVRNLAGWQPRGERTVEVPFIVSASSCRTSRASLSSSTSPPSVQLWHALAMSLCGSSRGCRSTS
jgi:aconitase A